MLRVVDIQAARLGRLLRARQITMQMTPALRRHLADAGYDPQYGARPLKRTMQRLVLDPLSRRLLEGTLEAGDDVRADWSEKVNEVVFEKIRKQEPVATPGRRAR